MNKRLLAKPIHLFAWCEGEYHPEIHITAMPNDMYEPKYVAKQFARLITETIPNPSFEILVEYLGQQMYLMLQNENVAEMMSNDPTFIRDHIRGFIHMLADSDLKQV